MSAPTSSVYMASTPLAQIVSGAERAARAPGENPSIVAAWGEDGFTFGDLLDLINPLQHLPVISTLYRKFTGDEIAPGPRLLGGGLFGGVLGVASAAVGVAVEAATGKDIGEHVLALFDGPEEPGTTAIAWATPRTGAVALAAKEPPAVALVARAETAPERGARAIEPGPTLAALDSGLVSIDREHVPALIDGRPEETGTTAIVWATPRTGAVVLAAEAPPAGALLAQAETAPERGARATEPGPSLAALDSGLVPIEPLLTHLALSSRDGDAAASDLYRLAGAGASSERLSAIELARILALYHENARKVQETQSAIDSAL